MDELPIPFLSFPLPLLWRKQRLRRRNGKERERSHRALVETVCSARTTIRIAGDDYPAELVKSKLMKLNSSHMEFVFDCISKNTTEIRNIKKYLLAVLFNAPSTINGYYTALVSMLQFGYSFISLNAHS